MRGRIDSDFELRLLPDRLISGLGVSRRGNLLDFRRELEIAIASASEIAKHERGSPCKLRVAVSRNGLRKPAGLMGLTAKLALAN